MSVTLIKRNEYSNGGEIFINNKILFYCSADVYMLSQSLETYFTSLGIIFINRFIYSRKKEIKVRRQENIIIYYTSICMHN